MKPGLFHAAPTVARLTNVVPGLAVNWDHVGVGGSVICLVHCLLLPLAAATVPGLVLFEGQWLHRWLAIALAASALLALIPGWRIHGRWLPGLLMAGGLAAVNTAAFAAPESWETRLTVLGGLCLIAAHGINHHLRRSCPRCAEGGGCHS